MSATASASRFAAALCWALVLPLQAQTLVDKVAEQTTAGLADEERGAVALAMTQDVTPAAALARPHHTATQSMLWARRQALSVGVGIEQRSNRGGELPAAGAQPGPLLYGHSLVIGVALATTARTSIALQAPVWTDTRERERQAAEPARMALRSRDSFGELRAGLQMKMQVSEQTTLAVRPRSRGVGVTLRSQW